MNEKHWLSIAIEELLVSLGEIRRRQPVAGRFRAHGRQRREEVVWRMRGMEKVRLAVRSDTIDIFRVPVIRWMKRGAAAPAPPASRASAARAAANSFFFCASTFGYARSSCSTASTIAAATTSRVNHLLLAGTTNHGACVDAVARIASSNARM